MSTENSVRQNLPQDLLPSGDDASHVDEKLLTAFTGHAPSLVCVDQETWDYFVSILDDPPANDGLTRVLQAPAPWHQ
jgi:hypothetical protein